MISGPSHFDLIQHRLIWGEKKGGYKWIGDGGVKGRWSLKLEDVRPTRRLYVVLDGILLEGAY